MTLESFASKTRVVSSLFNELLDRSQRVIGRRSLRGILALGDQAVVSGTRFATTVILGRACGAEELGAYGLGFTFVVLFTLAQESVITLPYTVFWARRGEKRRATHAGNILLQFLALTAVASVLLLVASTSLAVLSGHPLLARVLLTLSAFIPGFLLWEFARRMGFAHRRVRAVLVLDVLAAISFLIVLTSLAVGGGLSAATSYIAMGSAFGITAFLWLRRYGQSFRLRVQLVMAESLRSWRFGRWILASEATFMARNYVVPWMVAVLLGTAATGRFVAYLTVVLLANPLLHGISNVLSPDLALAYSEQGIGEVWRLVLKTTWVLGAAMFALWLVLTVGGEQIIGLLFGAEFTGHRACVVILATGLIAEAAGMPSYIGLWAVGRPNACFVACLIGLVATVFGTLAWTPTWGLAGAASGVTFGKFVSAAVQTIVFRRTVRGGVV